MTRPRTPAVWFLRNGNHLCHSTVAGGKLVRRWRPAGTGCDEYGRKTYWISVPFGILTLATRYFTWDEVLAAELAADPESGYADARLAWADFAETRGDYDCDDEASLRLERELRAEREES